MRFLILLCSMTILNTTFLLSQFGELADIDPQYREIILKMSEHPSIVSAVYGYHRKIRILYINQSY